MPDFEQRRQSWASVPAVAQTLPQCRTGAQRSIPHPWVGKKSVSCTVYRELVPGPYRVRLSHHDSGVVIEEKRADANGNCAFDGLREGVNYLAVGLDDERLVDQLNAGVSDLITAL